MKINNIKIKGKNNVVAIDSNLICIPAIPKIEIQQKEIEYQNRFTQKILTVFDLMNKYLIKQDEINIEVLSKLLNLNSSTYLVQYLNTKEEPEFKLLDIIADTLALSPDWLKYSQGNIFDAPTIHIYEYLDIIKYLKKDQKNHLIFLISEEEKPRIATYIYNYDNLYKYQRLNQICYFYSQVGAEGARKLYTFYLFLKKLNSESDLYIRTNAYKVPVQIFDAIIIGKYFPGCCFKEGYPTPFWEDLIDIENKYFKKEDYEKMYGSDFIKIQQIILERVKGATNE